MKYLKTCSSTVERKDFLLLLFFSNSSFFVLVGFGLSFSCRSDSGEIHPGPQPLNFRSHGGTAVSDQEEQRV